MKKIQTIGLCLLLSLFLGACAGYRGPSVSGDPARMSGDTLCFRYESSRDAALGAEIARRNLDCAGLLRDDPLYPGGPDRDTAYKMTR